MRQFLPILTLLAAACGANSASRPSLPPGELHVTRAVLYQNGIGYFERRGTIEGNRLTLRVRPEQIADFLKSLTVVDLNEGGRAISVALPVEKSRARQLADLPPQVREQGGILAMAMAFRGANATVATDDEEVTGRLVGVEQIDVPSKEGPPWKDWRVTVLADGDTLTTLRLAEVKTLRLRDRTLSVGLEKALDVSLQDASWKAVELTVELAGPSPHNLVASYVVEMPIWKPAYRVVVLGDGKLLLQGWAVIDNVSGDDWHKVKLSLTAGTPLAFLYDLYTPHYVRRPDLSGPTETMGVAPPRPIEAYGAANEEDWDGAPAAADDWGGAPSSRSARAPSAPPAGRAAPRAVLPEDLERGYRALVAGAPVGAIFRYDLAEPVTVKDRQSALVSIVSTRVPGEDVLLFRVGADTRNPYRTARFSNDTGLVLERGPMAIYREGTFLGEALVNRMEQKAQVFVPYALDTRVDVFLAQESVEEGMRLVSIVDGHLTAETKVVTRHLYEVENRSEETTTLYVQQPRRTGWTIRKVGLAEDGKGPPQPGKDGVIEERGVYYVPIALPKTGRVKLVVEEETPARREVDVLSSLGRGVVLVYLKAPDADPVVAKALEDALAASDRVAEIERRLADVNGTRGVLSQRAEELRANLELLGKTKGPDDLRRDLEKRFAEVERELDKLVREHIKLTEERALLRERLIDLVKRVSLKAK
ncbi:MAG: hypothetical protein EXR73_07990 [Myxococcales bacterium]|nr:hypothetical protein [Myxococcales bacterium]